MFLFVCSQGFFFDMGKGPGLPFRGNIFSTKLKKGKKISMVNLDFGENCIILKKFFQGKGPFKGILPGEGAF